MFLADAIFEVAKSPRPGDPCIEGLTFRMVLISLSNIREVASLIEGQYATYDQVVNTLARILPYWADMASQIAGMEMQFHTLQFDSREAIDELSNALKR